MDQFKRHFTIISKGYKYFKCKLYHRQEALLVINEHSQHLKAGDKVTILTNDRSTTNEYGTHLMFEPVSDQPTPAMIENQQSLINSVWRKIKSAQEEVEEGRAGISCLILYNVDFTDLYPQLTDAISRIKNSVPFQRMVAGFPEISR